MDFRHWLEMKFLEWQRNQGGRKTVMEFADYLGVGRSTVSMWWNKEGSRPQGENIRKLADKLGLEVYDVLGLDRPDEGLYFVTKYWEDLPDEIQKAITEKAEEYVARNESRKTVLKRKKSQT